MTELQDGALIEIPVDDDRAALAAVVATLAPGIHYFAALGDLRAAGSPLPEDPGALAPSLIALSFDTLVVGGSWPIVGVTEVSALRSYLPAWKVEQDGRLLITDYASQRTKDGSPDIAAQLEFETTVSPVRLQRALRAVHGIEPWTQELEALRPPAPHLRSEVIFQGTW